MVTNIYMVLEYGLLMPTVCRREHHSAIMYRQCRLVDNLDVYQPSMTLRNNRKIKF